MFMSTRGRVIKTGMTCPPGVPTAWKAKMTLPTGNNKGSVLLESLVAVVIMSVSLTVIIQAMANNLRFAQVHQGYSKALFLLEDRLQEAFFDGS